MRTLRPTMPTASNFDDLNGNTVTYRFHYQEQIYLWIAPSQKLDLRDARAGLPTLMSTNLDRIV